MLTCICCLFQPYVTAVAHTRPRSFCQKCKWQVTPKHANTLDPMKSELADYAAVYAQCGNLSQAKLKPPLTWNAQPQLSQLAEPLWTDPGLTSGNSVCKLISTLKNKQKKCKQGMNGCTLSQNPWKQRKSHHLAVPFLPSLYLGYQVPEKPRGKLSSFWRNKNETMKYHSMNSTGCLWHSTEITR